MTALGRHEKPAEKTVHGGVGEMRGTDWCNACEDCAEVFSPVVTSDEDVSLRRDAKRLALRTDPDSSSVPILPEQSNRRRK